MNTTSFPNLSPYRPEPFRLLTGSAGPTLGVLAKNPSAPDTLANPTFRSIARYAAANGYREVLVVNLFSRRAPDAADLNDLSYADAVGPDNDEAILAWAAACDRLVCAWGNPNRINPIRYQRRVSEVRRLLCDRALWSVGEPTALGHPRHPCRNGWPTSAPLRPYAGTIQTWE
jgi:hypothetical protein